ncbi:MAG: hypothetical protein IIZ59_01590 [Clostridia bacterium]|nr:hypothetical protein [Clostridia bacterium]
MVPDETAEDVDFCRAVNMLSARLCMVFSRTLYGGESRRRCNLQILSARLYNGAFKDAIRR